MSTDIVHTTRPADSLESKMTYARALASAGMLPAAYKQQPANVLVAIEYGEALGIKPIVAMNEINVISGTPSPSASLMASLARSAGHKVRAWNEDDGTAVCEIVRSDDPEFTHRARWDEAKARKAGLWGKGHWAKDPDTMLRWRAISECVRLACPEVLGGLKYTPEELIEIQADRGPQRVESEQVPVCPIPADWREKIAATSNPEWLAWARGRLDEYEDGWPDEVAEHRELIAAREAELAAELAVEAAPEHTEDETPVDIDDAQAVIEDVLEGEVVDTTIEGELE